MKYTRVVVDALGYELAPVVVTSAELEERLAPLYEELHFSEGQLEALTGISERRWWEKDTPLSQGAAVAARRALDASKVRPADIGALIYAGVNRESFEPATACRVASELGVGPDVAIFDVSNACLGMLNGMLDIANRIELGQIRAGLVVSTETAREINDVMIERMLEDPSMEMFTRSLATLTGGSGSAAILLTDGSFSGEWRRALVGGVTIAKPEYHALCRWGLEPQDGNGVRPIMVTNAISVLRNGLRLGIETWAIFLDELGWDREGIDKVICHQVGSTNRKGILRALEIPEEREFPSYEFLGNMGSVSLPLTAALAEEREFLCPGDRVSFLGIGSGLNCLMLGLDW